MWFKNLTLYRIGQWNETPESLEEKLASLSLQALSGLEMQSRGWLSVRKPGEPLVHATGSQLLICFGFEKKLLPSSVVNQVVKQKALDIEEREGFKPGRRRLKELKEEVTDELLPRAFAVRSQTLAWIDPVEGLLAIDTSSASKADDFVSLLIKSVDGLGLTPIKTKLSPTVAMTAWLAEDDCPPAFTVDRECELKGRGDEGATVRYVKHALESSEIAAHIQAGKDVTRLALTWRDRVSFVLSENGQIKRIAPLDVIKEQADQNFDEDSFDGDFTLMASELRLLIKDLAEALGGEMDRSAHADLRKIA